MIRLELLGIGLAFCLFVDVSVGFIHTSHGLTFTFHDKDLLLTFDDDACYFTKVHPNLRHKLSNDSSVIQVQETIYNIIRTNGSEINSSSLVDMRNWFNDLLADLHCVDKRIYSLIYPATHPTTTETATTTIAITRTTPRKPTEATFTTSPVSTSIDCSDKHNYAQVQADLEILLDASLTKTDHNIDTLKDYVKKVIETMGDGLRVGIARYGETTRKEFWLNEQDHHGLNKALDGIHAEYESELFAEALRKALKFVRENVFHQVNGGRPLSHQILVVVTGGDRHDHDATEEQVRLLTRDQVTVVVLKVGNLHGTPMNHLNLPTDHVFNVDAVDKLAGMDGEIRDIVCKDCHNHDYPQVDLEFLVDERLAPDDHFHEVLELIKKVTDHIHVTERGLHVGLATYASEPHVQFPLDSHLTSNDVHKALSEVHLSENKQYGNLTQALEFVQNNAFTEAHGDRPTAANVLLVVTPGDGGDNSATAQRAQSLRRDHVTIVGIRTESDHKHANDLNGVVSLPEYSYFGQGLHYITHFKEELEQAICTAWNSHGRHRK